MKIGMSSCGKVIDEALFAEYKEAGISLMEISTKDYESLDAAATLALSQKYGVELWSYHLPFMPFDSIDISFLDEEKRKKTVALLTRLIGEANKMRIGRCVIHASGEPIPEEERPMRMAQARKSLHELAREADKFGMVICVEDLPRTCLGRNSADMKELLSADENLVSCFDTNHLLKESFEDYLDDLGKLGQEKGKCSIVTLHVSDYDYVDEKHWLPGEGDVDWKKLIAKLQSIGYEGPWMYEVSPGGSRRGGILSCRDFYENACELGVD